MPPLFIQMEPGTTLLLMMERVVVLGRIVYTDDFLISEALTVSAYRHVRVDHAASFVGEGNPHDRDQALLEPSQAALARFHGANSPSPLSQLHFWVTHAAPLLLNNEHPLPLLFPHCCGTPLKRKLPSHQDSQ